MKQCPFGIECSACRFSRVWILTDGMGNQKAEERCSFEVVFENLPKLIGAIDGVQAATNETRNRVMEFGAAAVQTIEMAVAPKQIGTGSI